MPDTITSNRRARLVFIDVGDDHTLQQAMQTFAKVLDGGPAPDFGVAIDACESSVLDSRPTAVAAPPPSAVDGNRPSRLPKPMKVRSDKGGARRAPTDGQMIQMARDVLQPGEQCSPSRIWSYHAHKIRGVNLLRLSEEFTISGDKRLTVTRRLRDNGQRQRSATDAPVPTVNRRPSSESTGFTKTSGSSTDASALGTEKHQLARPVVSERMRRPEVGQNGIQPLLREPQPLSPERVTETSEERRVRQIVDALDAG